MYLGGKIKILPLVGKDLWEGLAMHLEVKKKLESGEGFTGKDSHAVKGKKP